MSNRQRWRKPRNQQILRHRLYHLVINLWAKPLRSESRWVTAGYATSQSISLDPKSVSLRRTGVAGGG